MDKTFKIHSFSALNCSATLPPVKSIQTLKHSKDFELLNLYLHVFSFFFYHFWGNTVFSAFKQHFSLALAFSTNIQRFSIGSFQHAHAISSEMDFSSFIIIFMVPPENRTKWRFNWLVSLMTNINTPPVKVWDILHIYYKISHSD